MEKYTEKDFLEMFREVKTREKKRKATTRGLVGVSARNFAKLVKAGYTPQEFENATVAMFRDADQWAVSTGNDIPEHLLRPDAFARYLNKYVNPSEKPKEEIPIKINAPQRVEVTEKQILEVDNKALEKSKGIYIHSLKVGEWTGCIFDAKLIGSLFSEAFTKEEKKQMLKDAEAEAEKKPEKKHNESTLEMLERMARNYPRNIMFEIAVKEAIKRKIQPSWLS